MLLLPLPNGAPELVDRDKFAHALRAAVTATVDVNHVFGADCVLYAGVGAGALRALGVPARLQVGEVVWRLGPGDADVLHHAASLGGATIGPIHTGGAAFHAWVRIEACEDAPAQLVDFTTWQLREKAALMDAFDGVHTRVQFCPPYLWVPEKSAHAHSARQVIHGFAVGIYRYEERTGVRGFVVPDEAEMAPVVAAALHAYRELLAGKALPDTLDTALTIQAVQV